MKESEPNATKREILDKALMLFSVYGYTAVSVRTLARAVGIRESSIYHHYDGKDAILQALLDRAIALTQIWKDRFNRALADVRIVEEEAFIKAGLDYVLGFLLDKDVYPLISMLRHEKPHNEKAAMIHRNLMFGLPLSHHFQVFSALIERGLLQEEEPMLLAAEYQALVLYAFDKYLSGPDAMSDSMRTPAAQELSALLRRFYRRHLREYNDQEGVAP
ncbi:MAG TPA: TetR/AcrR family transcriptional regulator [Clostridia bacterium]|nr:TetR/AcrR family transcriptional regulator [Clostridia bacterium]